MNPVAFIRKLLAKGLGKVPNPAKYIGKLSPTAGKMAGKTASFLKKQALAGTGWFGSAIGLLGAVIGGKTITGAAVKEASKGQNILQGGSASVFGFDTESPKAFKKRQESKLGQIAQLQGEVSRQSNELNDKDAVGKLDVSKLEGIEDKLDSMDQKINLLHGSILQARSNSEKTVNEQSKVSEKQSKIAEVINESVFQGAESGMRTTLSTSADVKDHVSAVTADASQKTSENIISHIQAAEQQRLEAEQEKKKNHWLPGLMKTILPILDWLFNWKFKLMELGLKIVALVLLGAAMLLLAFWGKIKKFLDTGFMRTIRLLVAAIQWPIAWLAKTLSDLLAKMTSKIPIIGKLMKWNAKFQEKRFNFYDKEFKTNWDYVFKGGAKKKKAAEAEGVSEVESQIGDLGGSITSEADIDTATDKVKSIEVPADEGEDEDEDSGEPAELESSGTEGEDPTVSEDPDSEEDKGEKLEDEDVESDTSRNGKDLLEGTSDSKEEGDEEEKDKKKSGNSFNSFMNQKSVEIDGDTYVLEGSSSASSIASRTPKSIRDTTMESNRATEHTDVKSSPYQGKTKVTAESKESAKEESPSEKPQGGNTIVYNDNRTNSQTVEQSETIVNFSPCGTETLNQDM